jgi:hypothetical protein
MTQPNDEWRSAPKSGYHQMGGLFFDNLQSEILICDDVFLPRYCEKSLIN